MIENKPGIQPHLPRQVQVLDQTALIYNDDAEEYKRIIARTKEQKPDYSLADLIYHADCQSLLNFYGQCRRLSVAISDVWQRNPQDLDRIDKNYRRKDVYKHQNNGVSLWQIEQLPLPLDLGSIKTINRFFHAPILSELLPYPLSQLFISPIGQLAREMAVMLPILDYAHPKETAIPTSLRPLHHRLTAYFDYYCEFLTNPALDFEQEFHYLTSAAFNGKHFKLGLACFTAARFGITPSSGVKFFLERANGTFVVAWKAFGIYVQRALSQAYRENSLPKNLEKYQLYNKQEDRKVTAALKPYYQKFLQRQEEVTQRKEEVPDDLLPRLSRYRKPLRSAILQSAEKSLSILLDHEAIEEIILTTQYRQTLMLILRLKNQSHLTLEINDLNRIFGIPPDLSKEFPNIADLMAGDLLPPILDFARKISPEAEPAVVKAKPLLISQAPVKLPEEIMPVPEKKPKRRWLPRPFDEPNPLPPPLPAERRFLVLYEREEVEEKAESRSAKVTDRLMYAIKRFEWEGRGAEKITHAPHFYRLKAGNKRIILEHHPDQRLFTIHKIPKRNEASYRDL